MVLSLKNDFERYSGKYLNVVKIITSNNLFNYGCAEEYSTFEKSLFYLWKFKTSQAWWYDKFMNAIKTPRYIFFDAWKMSVSNFSRTLNMQILKIKWNFSSVNFISLS